MLQYFFNNKKTAYFITLAVFFVVLDRFLKILALKQSSATNLIGNFFNFDFTTNPFISFSIPLGGIFIIILNFIILGLFIAYLISNGVSYPKIISPSLLAIFGAFSNLFDRIIYGFVIDYFSLRYFTVFNLADAMIVVGAGTLIYLLIFEKN